MDTTSCVCYLSELTCVYAGVTHWQPHRLHMAIFTCICIHKHTHKPRTVTPTTGRKIIQEGHIPGQEMLSCKTTYLFTQANSSLADKCTQRWNNIRHWMSPVPSEPHTSTVAIWVIKKKKLAGQGALPSPHSEPLPKGRGLLRSPPPRTTGNHLLTHRLERNARMDPGSCAHRLLNYLFLLILLSDWGNTVGGKCEGLSQLRNIAEGKRIF